jgi:serine/threonine-protein phosphatase 6 regulatory subunit 3
MFAFIRSQPDVMSRLLLHVETPPIVDLLVRIIQLDEQPTGAGVLEVRGTSFLTLHRLLKHGLSG